MKRENDISAELSKMGSQLADISCDMPYHVPGDYFADFGKTLHATIQELEIPDVQPGWSKAMPFAIPAGYLPELTSNIVAAAMSDELAAGLPRAMPLAAPQGYFDALPGQLLTAAKAGDAPKKETKVIPVQRRFALWPRQLAAAAVVLLTIGLGSYEYFFNQSVGPTDKILASVAPNDIQDYLQGAYRVDVDRVVSNTDVSKLQLDNKDIIEYLNETGWN